VRDQDLVLDAIEDAQRILAEYVEPASRRHPEATINMLQFLLDRQDVVAAVKRLRAGYGLRVVK
jgi:tRNA A37 threonylcarbamoyladenosine modification protein TsaB